MPNVSHIASYLDSFAPLSLAEEWDNVGLLLGDDARPVQRIMTCLTVTGASAEEAIERKADLIVSHHPLPFRPLKQMTTGSIAGGLLWRLASNGVSIYSPHTAFDSASGGINQQLAAGLELTDIRPLQEPAEGKTCGAGRYGKLAATLRLDEIAARLKAFLQIKNLHAVGNLSRDIQTIGVACGSAGEFLPYAERTGCQLLITGETSFHTCLDAQARDMCLLLTGHYASERFAVERLAELLATEFAELEVWASQQEADPVQWL